MNTGKAAFIALAATVAIPSLAVAGTYVESLAATHYSSPAQTQTVKMWVGNGRFRMEMQQGKQVQIFKDQTFYTLNVASNSYTKLDKAALEALTQKASDATKSLEALLPPERREKMKQQAKPKIDRTLKPTSRTESSALGKPCKVWEVFTNGAKSQEFCVVEVSTLPNGKELIATMQQVGEAFKGTAAGTGSMEVWQDVKTMDGYPVITRMYLNGKLFQEVKTTAIRPEATPDSLFVIPAGFKEQQLGEI